MDALPDSYRAVFMLREIEGLSTAETAAGLELGEEAVETRLHVGTTSFVACLLSWQA